jgi:hypothetical protein
MANADDLQINVRVNTGPALRDVENIRKALEAVAATPSPRLSFKGWLFSVWLAKNKGFVKTVLAPVSAILTGGVLEPGMLKTALIAAGLGLLTIAFKLAWDAFDYFVSEGAS